MSEHSVFAKCDICARDISYGNAILEVSRNVERHRYQKKTGRHSVTVAEAVPLVTLCAGCGNSMANRKKIRKSLLAETGLLDIHDDDAIRNEAGLVERCDCCGLKLAARQDRVSVVRMVGQMDWSETFKDGTLSVIDGEDIVSFCPDCGYKMNNQLLKQAFQDLTTDIRASSGYGNHDDLHSHGKKTGPESKAMTENQKYLPHEWQPIMKVGSEGGCICLYGRKGESGDWEFLRETDERALANLLSDEDAGLASNAFTRPVKGWKRALKLLSRYPWPCLYPLYVHQDFSKLVMIALKDYKGDSGYIDFAHWDRVCFGEML